jgi:hypothetical protein
VAPRAYRCQERRRVSRGHSSRRACRHSVPWSGSNAGKRRPELHGQGSLPPSFSINSVSTPTTRSPRLTRVSLEGTPCGACWSVQKDVSVSCWSWRMTTSRCSFRTYARNDLRTLCAQPRRINQRTPPQDEAIEQATALGPPGSCPYVASYESLASRSVGNAA